MADRQPLPTDPATIVRVGAIAAGSLALAWFSFAAAMTNITHRRAPETALRFTPGDPVALAVQADRRFAAKGVNAIGDAEIARAARDSLAGLALNPVALRLIGLNATAGKTYAAGSRAMRAGNSTSRRDVTTQFWLIEEAVARNDIAGALSHYDNVLRVEPGSQQLLFPVLTAALEDKALWKPMARYVAEPAPWLGDFARYAIRNSRQPMQLARFFASGGGLPKTDVFASLETELLKRIARTGSAGDMAAYYRSLAGADPAALSSADFTGATTEPRFAPVTWELFSAPGVSGAFLRDETGEAIRLHVTMDASASGLLAHKSILVRPGGYRFSASQRIADAAEGASARWELRCVQGEKATVVWSGSGPLSREAASVSGAVTIPAGCGAVTLRLLGSAGPSANGIEAIFGPVALTPSH